MSTIIRFRPSLAISLALLCLSAPAAFSQQSTPTPELTTESASSTLTLTDPDQVIATTGRDTPLTINPPPIKLTTTNQKYKAPDFCPRPPGADPMVVYLKEPKAFVIDEGKLPEGIKATNVLDFVCRMFPVALRMDREVFAQRRYVEYLQAQGIYNSSWLAQLGQDYGLGKDWAPRNLDDLNILLERVDIAPLPLLLAQGGLESTWGTSRFAAGGYNFFGIHGPGEGGCMESNSTPPVCVRKYLSISGGVSDYIAFLNTQTSQEPFRQARLEQRKANGDVATTPGGVALDPIKIAQTLGADHYSQIGMAYAERLESVMNDFHFLQFAFDEARMPPLKIKR